MKFKWYLNDGFIAGDRWREFEIPDEELEGMTEKEIEEEAFDWAKDEMWKHCSLEVRKVEEG